MILRRADCGHYISEDTPPAGHEHGSGRDVFLCNPCRDAARAHVQVETKDIKPGSTQTIETSHVSVVRDEAGRPLASAPTTLDLAQYPDFRGFEDTPPAERGRIAAVAGDTEEDCPYPDKRTREAKEWLRGFREAKADA